MVTDIFEARLVMLFIEALAEPLCGWVNAYRSTTLHDDINKTLSNMTLPNRARVSYSRCWTRHFP